MVAKCRNLKGLLTTKCIINGGSQFKFVVSFKLHLVSWDNDALRKPATAYAQTLKAEIL